MSLPEEMLKKWREQVGEDKKRILGTSSHQSASPQVPPPPPLMAEPRVVELLRTLPPEFRIDKVERIGIIRPRLRVTVSTRASSSSQEKRE